MTQRERIEAIRAKYEAAMRASTGGDDSTEAGAALDALGEVLVVVTERERLLREHIEALSGSEPFSSREAQQALNDVLGVFDD